MESVKDILKKRIEQKGPVHAKHEFQEYGVWLSEQLHDKSHKGLYIKLAKERPRAHLDQARVFATEVESSSVNRGRLFMWKLGELSKEAKNSQKTKKGNKRTRQ